jgi:hypothetical protein
VACWAGLAHEAATKGDHALLAYATRKAAACARAFAAARSGEGAVGALAFGRSRGVTEGVAAALGLPIVFPTPATWKRLVGIAPDRNREKDAARSEVIRRWPDHAGPFARVKDVSRAGAALIAVGGLVREAMVPIADARR